MSLTLFFSGSSSDWASFSCPVICAETTPTFGPWRRPPRAGGFFSFNFGQQPVASGNHFDQLHPGNLGSYMFFCFPVGWPCHNPTTGPQRTRFPSLASPLVPSPVPVFFSFFLKHWYQVAGPSHSGLFLWLSWVPLP